MFKKSFIFALTISCLTAYPLSPSTCEASEFPNHFFNQLEFDRLSAEYGYYAQHGCFPSDEDEAEDEAESEEESEEEELDTDVNKSDLKNSGDQDVKTEKTSSAETKAENFDENYTKTELKTTDNSADQTKPDDEKDGTKFWDDNFWVNWRSWLDESDI